MDFDEFEKSGGKPDKPAVPCCDPRLPEHYKPTVYVPRSHDGHLGAVESDWEESYGNNPQRDHFGFRIDRKLL